MNPAAIMQVLGPLKEIMSLFDNPTTRIFRDILADINAVIGQALTPVFRVANTVMRMVGDTLAGIAPAFANLMVVFEDAFRMLKPLWDTALHVVSALVSAWLGVIKVWWNLIGAVMKFLGFGDVIEALTSGWEFVGKKILLVMKFIEQAVRGVSNLLEGKGLPDAGEMWRRAKAEAEKAWNFKPSSANRRETTAAYMDFEDYAKKARLSAFQTGLGLTEDQKRTKLQEDANKKLDQIAENTEKWRDIPGIVVQPPGMFPQPAPLLPKPNP